MKPYVICHMVSSVDGRQATSRWSKSPDGNLGDWSASYATIHDAFKGDAWMVGRVTMAEMVKGRPHAPAAGAIAAKPFHRAADAAAPYAIALDASGKLHFDRSAIDGDHIIVLLGRQVLDSHLAELAADGVSYVVSAHDELDLGAMLETLNREFGVERLLLEGGGGINASFFSAGLVDEFSVLIVPALDGQSDSRGIVEAGDIGLAAKLQLSLTSCERLEHGEIHLRYAVRPH